VNSQQLAFVIVVYESRVFEPVHEKADARSGSAYHFRQSLMADGGNGGRECPVAIKMGELQQDTRESFLAPVAMLVQ